MTNLPQEICLKFKEARKAKGYNQSALARMVGCKQSAISMFEAGMTTKLSDDIVRKLSDVLNVSLESEKEEVPIQVQSLASCGAVVRGYCPNGDCPSNVPYLVSGRLLYRPLRDVASPAGGKRCTQCGEVLEMACPSCGAPLNDGACCAVCGNAYVTPTLSGETNFDEYVRARRDEISQLDMMTKKR